LVQHLIKIHLQSFQQMIFGFNFSEYMNVDFVTKILSDIEDNELKSSNDEKKTECMINLLLSYNLQFSKIESNITLKGLAQRDNAKVLTENLLILLNTES